MGLSKRRVWHYLKDNKTIELPQNIVFVDTETIEVKINELATQHNLRLGVACYIQFRGSGKKPTTKWKVFEEASSFWNWLFSLTREKTRLYIISHNLEFDIPVLGGFEVLKTRDWKFIKLINNHHTNIWTFRKGNSSICFLDNMNYFNVSLAELGKSIGLEKLPMPSLDACDGDWLKYCQRDVEIMVTAWQHLRQFIIDHELGSFAKSIPAQALNAYRHRFMPIQIGIHDNHEAVELERQAYFGGRVECFRLGQCSGDTFYKLDINSMYPYVMAQGLYPTRILGVRKSPSIEYLISIIKKKAVIARVILQTPEPCFPVRYNDKLCFPIGRFETTLATPELELALNKGYVKSCYKVVIYEKANLFRHYVNYFYNLRLKYRAERNTAFEYICKIMLNSLYGKFGQKLEVWEKVGEFPNEPDGYWREYDDVDKAWYSYRSINGVRERATGFDEGYNTFVAIPAHVTSYARVYLWKLIQKGGLENVYYSDTDSLIVNSTGLDHLRCYCEASTLGALKIESKGSALTINNAKDYILDGEHKQKGIRKDALKVGENEFRQVKFRRLRGAIHEGDINRVTTSMVTKKLKQTYDKGVIDSYDVVSPFILLYSIGRNWYDYEAMLAKYGNLARFDGKYLDEWLGIKIKWGASPENPMADYRPGDRAMAAAEDLEERRQGSKLYQRRGKCFI